MTDTTAQTSPEGQNIADAKRLLRVSRLGALASLGPDGSPLTTLVTVASDYDGSPLLLMSMLSQHTKNLLRDPRAGLLLSAPASRGDPLNSPRLSLSGRISRFDQPHARRRFIRTHPKSKLYAEFADFAFYRLDIKSVHFNGGFGRAAPMTAIELLTPVVGAEALLEAEERLLAEINAERANPIRLGPISAEVSRRWRAASLDPEGVDLVSGSQSFRRSFASPALSIAAWRAAARLK